MSNNRMFQIARPTDPGCNLATTNAPVSRRSREIAGRLRDFVDAHPNTTRWNIGEVCKDLQLFLSSRQVRRLFRHTMGIGFREYAKQARLRIAAAKLHATNAPIKEIAAELGYSDAKSFHRSFKATYGFSPGEYRKALSQKQRN
jgi:AraC-like DNA-binding protein